MADSTAHATWEGDLLSGHGKVDAGSGVFTGLDVSWAARTERPSPLTSPEELIAAAHATCLAMALSNTLAQDGTPPERLEVDAVCHFGPLPEGGFSIRGIDLNVQGRVPGIDQAAFADAAGRGEQGCPVSNALRGNVEIRLTATLQA